jgi:hypothetical protein
MSLVENLSHPLVSALGWTLLNALWQILVIALLWRSALYFARKASASIRYNLSLLALLAIPVVSAPTLFSGSMPFIRKLPASFHSNLTTACIWLRPKEAATFS